MLNRIHTAYRGIISDKCYALMHNFIEYEKTIDDTINSSVITNDLSDGAFYSAMFDRRLIEKEGDRGFNNLKQGMPQTDNLFEIVINRDDKRITLTFAVGDNQLKWEVAGIQYANHFEEMITLLDEATTLITSSSVAGNKREFTLDSLNGQHINYYL